MRVCVDIWYRRRKPAWTDGEAACRRSHSADGHPGSLAQQQVRWTQRLQTASWNTAGGGGSHHVCQRTLLSAQQVCKEAVTQQMFKNIYINMKM